MWPPMSISLTMSSAVKSKSTLSLKRLASCCRVCASKINIRGGQIQNSICIAMMPMFEIIINIVPSVSPKTMTHTIVNGMSGRSIIFLSPPAPTRSRGARRVDLALPRGTTTRTSILVRLGLTGRRASTIGGGTVQVCQECLHTGQSCLHFIICFLGDIKLVG